MLGSRVYGENPFFALGSWMGDGISGSGLDAGGLGRMEILERGSIGLGPMDCGSIAEGWCQWKMGDSIDGRMDR